MEIEKQAIQAICLEKNIKMLCHFTRVENLPSIVRNGIVPRVKLTDLTKDGEVCIVTDQYRYDGQLTAISLSVTFPNYKMFYPKRKEEGDHVWCVILLDPSILWIKDCAFYSRNAASSKVTKYPASRFKSAKRLKKMFYRYRIKSGEIIDGSERNPALRMNEPTNPQAEVLVFGEIEVGYIQRIVFYDAGSLSSGKKLLGTESNKVVLQEDAIWFKPRRDYEDWR